MLMSFSCFVGWRSSYFRAKLRLLWSRAGFLASPPALSLVTVTLQAARSPRSEMAVMVAVPALRPVTLPSPSTVATVGLELIQTMK